MSIVSRRMPSLRRLTEIWRTEGAAALGAKTARYGVTQLCDAYWMARRTRTLTRSGATATFSTKTRQNARDVSRLPLLESPMLGDFLGALTPTDVVYDVGAYTGLYTCFAADIVSDTNVIIFEPNPHNLPRLRRNLALNGLSSRVVETALADTSERVQFNHPTLDQQKWGAKGSIAPTPQTEGAHVNARAGDELVAAGEIPIPTVVKIDVEGAESLVIDGLQDTLSRDECRLLYCEIHRPNDYGRSTEAYGTTSEEVVEAIESLGFATEQLAERPAEVLLKGTKQ